jgi:hypothetical protein
MFNTMISVHGIHSSAGSSCDEAALPESPRDKQRLEHGQLWNQHEDMLTVQLTMAKLSHPKCLLAIVGCKQSL